jgi:glycine/D-amino acid oxidase-like deaminating enzyme
MINDTPTVAIIGGGLSGTLLAVQLLRNARYPVRVKVVEPRPRLGRGYRVFDCIERAPAECAREQYERASRGTRAFFGMVAHV